MNRADKHTIATGKVWEEFGNQFGWTLNGWSDEHTAQFCIDKPSGTFGHQWTKREREAVQAAIDEATVAWW